MRHGFLSLRASFMKPAEALEEALPSCHVLHEFLVLRLLTLMVEGELCVGTQSLIDFL